MWNIFLTKIKKIQVKKQDGFTLLETLVAIFILSLALTGPIYIATLGIRTAVSSRDGISARYLAEEVIEYFRNQRDYRSLRGSEFSQIEWLKDITGNVDCMNVAGDDTDTCELRINSAEQYSIQACASGNCSRLRFNPNSTTAFYGVEDPAALESKFSREFHFEVSPNDGSATDIPLREVKLVVRIRWDDHSGERVYTVSENLFNIAYSTHAQ